MRPIVMRRPHSWIHPGVGWFVILLAWLTLAAGAEAQDVVRYLEAPVNPRSGVPCPSRELYSPLRPDPAGVPTVVALYMAFQDISRFNDTEQTMTADVYVAMRWRDPRLADPARGDGSADCPVPGKELWMPLIEPENLRSRQQFYEPRFLVDANGTITVLRRTLIEVANSLDLHEFPFDRHQFRITLWPSVSGVDELVFHPVGRGPAINRGRATMGWAVGNPTASVQESERVGRMGVYSRYDLVIELTRDWGYYAWKLGVPLLLIVLMAYTVYFIPPTNVAQQVAVGMTSMLTLVAYMLALGNSLPKISYLTRADKLFVGCAFLVFLGLLKAILTTVLVQRETKEAVRRIDRFGRWAYPAVLLVVILIALVL
jgi:hypothetical protein